MNKGLLTAFTIVIAVLTTKPANAQAHTGIPNPHAPVHHANNVPKAVRRAYQDAIDNGFLIVTGEPEWTRQNGLLVASVPATHQFAGPGVGIFRFKPNGGIVLSDFVPDDPFWNTNN